MANNQVEVYSKKKIVSMKPATHEKLIEIAKSRGENVTLVIREAIETEIKYFEEVNEKP